MTQRIEVTSGDGKIVVWEEGRGWIDRKPRYILRGHELCGLIFTGIGLGLIVGITIGRIIQMHLS